MYADTDDLISFVTEGQRRLCVALVSLNSKRIYTQNFYSQYDDRMLHFNFLQKTVEFLQKDVDMHTRKKAFLHVVNFFVRHKHVE